MFSTQKTLLAASSELISPFSIFLSIVSFRVFIKSRLPFEFLDYESYVIAY